MQRSDFAGLFKAMDGFPVVIRTLDPPLHEFLPKRENLMVDVAVLPYADIKAKKEMSERYRIPVKDLKKALPELLHRVEELHEFNPMLGHRGCRLGVTYPGDHRNAVARDLRSRRSGGEEGHQGNSRNHDSADRQRGRVRKTRRRSWFAWPTKSSPRPARRFTTWSGP